MDPSEIKHVTLREPIDLRFKPTSKYELKQRVNEYIDSLPEFFDCTDVQMSGVMSTVLVKAHKNYTGEVPSLSPSSED